MLPLPRSTLVSVDKLGEHFPDLVYELEDLLDRCRFDLEELDVAAFAEYVSLERGQALGEGRDFDGEMSDRVGIPLDGWWVLLFVDHLLQRQGCL